MYAHSYQNIFLQAFSIEMNWNAKRLHRRQRQYLVSRGRSVLYPPKFLIIVIKLPAELMRTVQPAFAVQARHRESERRERE